MVESANAAQGFSHYLNRGQQKWAFQARYSAVIVTVPEVCFAYRCSARGNECQNYYALLCRGKKKRSQAPCVQYLEVARAYLDTCTFSKAQALVLARVLMHKHTHKLPVFLNVRICCLHVFLSLFVCAWGSMPTASAAYCLCMDGWGSFVHHDRRILRRVGEVIWIFATSHWSDSEA